MMRTHPYRASSIGPARPPLEVTGSVQPAVASGKRSASPDGLCASPLTRIRTLVIHGGLALLLAGCGISSETLEVALSTERLRPEESATWAQPALQSSGTDVTVRQVFTAQGPCRALGAELLPTYPGEYMLRVVATEVPGCESDTPHIGYSAELIGLPPGSHQLRIVHVGADGRTLTETVFEHPIRITRE